MLKTDQYYEVDQDIIDFFVEREKEFAFGLDLKYVYQVNNKQKQLIKITKIPDNYAVLLDANMLVTINDDYFYKMENNGDDINKILFEQELDKIQINFDKGTYKITQPSFKSSVGLIHKHTYESVERAYETQRLLSESKADEQK